MGRGITRLAQEVVAMPAVIPAPAKQAIYPGHYAWPELRISRRAAWKDQGNRGWNDHLNDLGERNRRRGSARVLGEISCTYISDTEIRAMLLQGNPKLRNDVRHAHDLYDGLRRRINQFIKETARDQTEVEQLMECGERFGVGPVGDRYRVPRSQSGMWVKSSFEVGKLDSFGHNQIGVDLGENDELRAERIQFIRYLRREEKLPTDLIDPNWEPHAVVFDVRANLKAGELALRYAEERPDTLIFAGPYASTDV